MFPPPSLPPPSHWKTFLFSCLYVVCIDIYIRSSGHVVSLAGWPDPCAVSCCFLLGGDTFFFFPSHLNKILDQAVEDMQKDLVKIRQSYAEVCVFSHHPGSTADADAGAVVFSCIDAGGGEGGIEMLLYPFFFFGQVIDHARVPVGSTVYHAKYHTLAYFEPLRLLRVCECLCLVVVGVRV